MVRWQPRLNPANIDTRPTCPQRGNAATEPREAFGVRGACSRFRRLATFDSGSKLHALQTLRDYANLKQITLTLLRSTLHVLPKPHALPVISGEEISHHQPDR